MVAKRIRKAIRKRVSASGAHRATLRRGAWKIVGGASLVLTGCSANSSAGDDIEQLSTVVQLMESGKPKGGGLKAKARGGAASRAEADAADDDEPREADIPRAAAGAAESGGANGFIGKSFAELASTFVELAPAYHAIIEHRPSQLPPRVEVAVVETMDRILRRARVSQTKCASILAALAQSTAAADKQAIAEDLLFRSDHLERTAEGFTEFLKAYSQWPSIGVAEKLIQDHFAGTESWARRAPFERVLSDIVRFQEIAAVALSRHVVDCNWPFARQTIDDVYGLAFADPQYQTYLRIYQDMTEKQLAALEKIEPSAFSLVDKTRPDGPRYVMHCPAGEPDEGVQYMLLFDRDQNGTVATNARWDTTQVSVAKAKGNGRERKPKFPIAIVTFTAGQFASGPLNRAYLVEVGKGRRSTDVQIAKTPGIYLRVDGGEVDVVLTSAIDDAERRLDRVFQYSLHDVAVQHHGAGENPASGRIKARETAMGDALLRILEANPDRGWRNGDEVAVFLPAETREELHRVALLIMKSVQAEYASSGEQGKLSPVVIGMLGELLAVLNEQAGVDATADQAVDDAVRVRKHRKKKKKKKAVAAITMAAEAPSAPDSSSGAAAPGIVESDLEARRSVLRAEDDQGQEKDQDDDGVEGALGGADPGGVAVGAVGAVADQDAEEDLDEEVEPIAVDRQPDRAQAANVPRAETDHERKIRELVDAACATLPVRGRVKPVQVRKAINELVRAYYADTDSPEPIAQKGRGSHLSLRVGDKAATLVKAHKGDATVPRAVAVRSVESVAGVLFDDATQPTEAPPDGAKSKKGARKKK